MSGGLQILIPMAGKGRRFAEAGYEKPKPFIDVDGVPMVERVVYNLPTAFSNDGVVLNALEEHREMAESLSLRCPVKTLLWGANPDGTAATIYDFRNEFRPDDPLLIANSDQWVDWNHDHFAAYVWREDCDGAIVTFRASGAKWSYAKFGDDMVVTEVAEKVPISQDATVGIYYWRRAVDCFESIKKMMDGGRRVNNEYYLCPSYNEMIVDGARIIAYPVPRMWGLGTPADLKLALEARPWKL